MPTKALHPCTFPPGCPQLTTASRCAQHNAKKLHYAEHPRGSSTQQGYGSRWRRERKAFLEANPYCVANVTLPVGRYEDPLRMCYAPATIVDHIRPHKGDPGLFWDQSNWRPMCKRHHDSATAKYDGRWGRPTKDKPQ